MEEFLKSIGIDKPGVKGEDNTYVVDLDDYDEYGKIYSILEKSDKIDEIQDASLINIHNTDITYANEKYHILLQGDLDNDIYKLVVIEV